MSAEALAGVLVLASAACGGAACWFVLVSTRWFGHALGLLILATVGYTVATLVAWWAGSVGMVLAAGMGTAVLAGLVADVYEHRWVWREWS